MDDMKLMLAAAVAALICTPALAREKSQQASNAAKDPNEVVCKTRATTGGIPRKFCATRREWDRENERTRQDMMLSQKGFCGRGNGC
jgi:hypothetical protein